MNQKRIPLIFSPAQAKKLEVKVQSTYSSESIPQFLRDVIEHDVNAKVHRVGMSYETDGSYDESLFDSGMIAQINKDYRLAFNLEDAVKNYYLTWRVSPSQVAQDAIDEFKTSDAYKGFSSEIPIHLEVEENAPIVTSAPLTQVILYNFLKNASLYAKDTSHLDVNIKNSDTHTIISVSDYGSKPLSPDESIKRKKTGGLGKGLAMNSAKNIMNMYGGKLSHEYSSPESKTNKGTTFNLEFPRMKLYKNSL